VTTILSFVFVLGVLIFVHELGHFLMARRIGVRVLTFSLGFGPKLLAFKRGDTEYCVSAIPLGGYVKMAGETTEDERTGAPDEFLSKSKWQRFQVLIMGPVMNLVLAVVLLTVVIYQGASVALYDSEPVVLGTVVEDSAARKAGLQPGDRVLAVGGIETPNWERFFTVLAPRAKREVDLTIERGGRTQQVTVVPDAVGRYEQGMIGVLPAVRPQVITVTPGAPAAEGGLRPNDVIVAVAKDGQREERPSYERVLQLIRASESQPLAFEVLRGSERATVTVTPRAMDGAARVGAEINPYEVRTFRPGLIEAAGMSLQRNWDGSVLILKTLGGLFTGQVSVKQLMGPVAIADQSRIAASQGWVSLLGLMAMISLNLGLLNLMPIPVLDGGHILILALEGLARRDFSVAVKEKMLLAGFALLVLLMVTVIYNDLARLAWVQRVLPWR
jgi:regulator of sigma E protease